MWAFSKTNVNNVVCSPRYLRHAVAIADLFAARFDPDAPLPDARYQVSTTSQKMAKACNVVGAYNSKPCSPPFSPNKHL